MFTTYRMYQPSSSYSFCQRRFEKCTPPFWRNKLNKKNFKILDKGYIKPNSIRLNFDSRYVIPWTKSVNLTKINRENLKNDFAEYSTSQKRILEGKIYHTSPNCEILTGTHSKSATAISVYKIAATNCHWKLISKF